MGLQVTINAEQDCENTQISFWDNTPDYNASSAPYGYGTPNVARGDADVDGIPDIPVTTFTWFHENDLTGFIGSTLLNGVYQGKDVGFLPTTSATKFLFTPAIMYDDSAKTEFPEGCYNVIYNVYGPLIATGSSALTVGTQYYVDELVAGTAGTATVASTVYTTGTTFIAASTNLASLSGATVHILKDSDDSNLMYWCGTRACLRTLLLKSVEEKCEKDCDFVESISRMDTELTAIMVSYEEGSIDCACEGLSELKTACTEFLGKCCC